MAGSRQDSGGGLLLLALLFVGCALSGLTPIADGDVYWHLAAAREMLRSGTLLTSDPFSPSAAGRPWFDVHWLFQLALYAVHAHGGLRALVIAKSVLVGLGAISLFHALDRDARAVFVPLCITALFFARHLLLLRPVIVSLVLMAFFFQQLEHFRRHGRARALYALPIAQAIWSNCQGLFALGPALIGAYLLEAGAELRWPTLRDEQRLSAAAAKHRCMALSLSLVATLLAALATPYGARLLYLPWKLLGRLTPQLGNPFGEVAENVPPFVLDRAAQGQFWHLKWFLALLVLGVIVSARHARLAHLVLLCGLAGLALIANRNVLLLYWIATPILAEQLAPQIRRLVAALARRIGWLSTERIAGALALLALCCAGTAAARETAFDQPAAFRFPQASAALLARAPGGGTIFSADQDGGYLIWMLYPRFKPYIDTRLVLRTRAQYREYLNLAEDPGRFDAFARREGFAYVTLPIAYPDRYLHLVAHLYRSPEWTLTFTDGSETLFVRRDLERWPALDERAGCGQARCDLGESATIDRIVAAFSRRFSSSKALRDAARIQLASLAIAVGEFAQAERILRATDAADALALRARAHLAAGDLDRAQAIGEQLMHEDDRDVRNLDLMAMVYVSRGEFEAASKLLRRALAIDPYDSEATSLLATMEEHHDEH